MSEGVRPIDVVRSEMDQLAAQLATLERQIVALLIAVALLSLIVMGLLAWRD